MSKDNFNNKAYYSRTGDRILYAFICQRGRTHYDNCFVEDVSGKGTMAERGQVFTDRGLQYYNYRRKHWKLKYRK